MAELEMERALELTIGAVGAKYSDLSPTEWAEQIAEYTSALVRTYRGLARRILEWGDPVYIPGVVESIQNPFIAESGETRQLAKVVFRPDRTRLNSPVQTLWVDLSPVSSIHLLQTLEESIGSHCIVTKMSRYSIDSSGNRKKSATDPDKDDQHPYLVDIRMDHTGPVASESSAAKPAAAKPAAAKPAAAKPAAAKPAAAKPAAAKPAAAKPAAAKPAAEDDGLPTGYDSAAEASAMRELIRSTIVALPADQSVAARTWIANNQMQWPLSKARAEALLAKLETFAEPAAVTIAEPEPESAVTVQEVEYDEAAEESVEDEW